MSPNKKETLVLTIPTLYGDHHTVAVRGILEAMEGVELVRVSSAFHQVTLGYDPSRTSEEAVVKALAEQGYDPGAAEPMYASSLTERSTRHTNLAHGSGGSLSFAEQTLVQGGRPLWPCPGFDVRSPHKVA
jgi:copper chaperone CopZ